MEVSPVVKSETQPPSNATLQTGDQNQSEAASAMSVKSRSHAIDILNLRHLDSSVLDKVNTKALSALALGELARDIPRDRFEPFSREWCNHIALCFQKHELLLVDLGNPPQGVPSIKRQLQKELLEFESSGIIGSLDSELTLFGANVTRESLAALATDPFVRRIYIPD